MAVPTVVIAGRPNVGKSSLFNMLAGSRIAIVDAFPGVTRDRISKIITHDELTFELVDTGGVGLVDSQGLEEEITRQIEIAFSEADLVLFVVDPREGLLPADADIARRLRELSRSVILVANKTESSRARAGAVEFCSLGLGDAVLTSALAGTGHGELTDRIAGELGAIFKDAKSAPAEGARIALVGKRNVGKSTLLNLLCGSLRVIVSPIPGTTRDSIDVAFERGGKTYVAIDTAGLRREKSIQGSVDFYSQARTHRSIRRADVVFFMIDAETEISRIDKKLADLVASEFKPVIVIVNKWDIATARGIPPERYTDYMADRLPGLAFAPLAMISAKTGFNVPQVLSLADDLLRQSRERLSTGQLNRILQLACAARSPRPRHGRSGNILYATQIAVAPPTIVLFVNDPSLFEKNYLRYIAARFRREGPYGEIPIRLLLRRRAREETRRERPR